MNTVSVPGFTAEAALVTASRVYLGSSGQHAPQGEIVPQMPFSKCYKECRKEGGSVIGCGWHCLWE